MAERAGLTLEEAAGAAEPAEPRQEAPARQGGAAAWESASLGRFAHALHLMDHYLQRDKARREAALQAAQKRGLDAAERKGQPSALANRNSSNRPPLPASTFTRWSV